ncbi:MAG: hypothetical protein ACJ77E_20185, partial [Gaiellaceae bacterium]
GQQAHFFRHLDAARDATYSGPQAVGHGTSDGLFLFALVPGTPDAPVTVTTSDGSKVGFGNGAFDDVATDGAKQPSGCVVAG